jgi:hypothetical protein
MSIEKDLGDINFNLTPIKDVLEELLKKVDQIEDMVIGFRKKESNEIMTIIPAGVGFEGALWITVQMQRCILEGEETDE